MTKITKVHEGNMKDQRIQEAVMKEAKGIAMYAHPDTRDMVEKAARFAMMRILSSTLKSVEEEAVRKERERIVREIEELKTNEIKSSVFGKGMDSWEARSYDEKQLVNAVLKKVLSIIQKRLYTK